MDGLARGDVVIVAGSGDFAGKPRPAIVVQSDLFNPTHASVTLVPVTTTSVDAPLFRIPIQTSKSTGLKKPSHAMVDKVVSVRRDRIGGKIGRVTAHEIERVDQALRLWLSL